MTDTANNIKRRNDLVMRIIKFICIFLLNLNTQIKPCSQGDGEKKGARAWLQDILHNQNSILLIFPLQLISKWNFLLLHKF